MKSSQTKQKVLASAMSLFLLGSTAIGAEKKTLDKIVEPAAKKIEASHPKDRNLSLTGLSMYNDDYGNLGGEFNFGTFYNNKGSGFLVGFGFDFPKSRQLISDFNTYDWERMGVKASFTGLLGNSDKVLYGPVVGVGIQSGYVSYNIQNAGSTTVKVYSPDDDKNRNSVFGELGFKALIPMKRLCYVVIGTGFRFGVKPTVQGNSPDNARVENKGKTGYFVTLGLDFEMPWQFWMPNK